MKSHAADEVAAEPTELPTIYKAFAQVDVPVGNVEFIAELKAEGKLGLFLRRDKARREPVEVTLNVVNYHTGIYTTVHDSLVHLLRSKAEFNDDVYTPQRIAGIALQLANGACLVTYLKLHALLLIELPARYNYDTLKRPKSITDDLPVVAPFAFAIQQLGAVNIASLRQVARYVPVLPTGGHVFGIPDGHRWDPNQYDQAVECARKLGVQFDVVDVKHKSGTAWWLLPQHYAEDVFELKLPFPETNFTSSMALTHTLFIFGHAKNPTNVIFDLSPCGTADYGSILRDPHTGINVSTFQNIYETAN